VGAVGLSTSNFEYIKAFNEYSGGACATLQIDYSILNRTPEAEILPYCIENNIGVIIRGPLAMGILTGKFSPETKFEASDWRNRWLDNPEEREVFLDDLSKVEKLRELTNEGRSLVQLAIQFVLQHEAVTTVIPGAKTKSQFVETVGVATLGEFTKEDHDFLNEITPVGGGRKIWPA
jgi:aryl-alcohol dehydrogenase-like predicted oxidoreductase